MVMGRMFRWFVTLASEEYADISTLIQRRPKSHPKLQSLTLQKPSHMK
jgi:hypothetical protein